MAVPVFSMVKTTSVPVAGAPGPVTFIFAPDEGVALSVTVGELTSTQ